MSSPESDLLDGLARALATASVATYRSDGSAYLAGETAVVFDAMPASPDRVVCLTPYGSNGDQPTQNLGQVRVQARVRGTAGNAADARDLAAAVFGALHGLTSVDYGTCHVIQCLRISSVPMGQDGSRRFERADNYAVDLNTPPTTARPA